ncbi:M28 family peptidase [Streptomyces sp. B6B3]|uniref:M28 family peptidase n=1 Tax=Streptomyces sp. B6B3 TaxID=3153570 RepID=UPI00325E7552
MRPRVLIVAALVLLPALASTAPDRGPAEPAAADGTAGEWLADLLVEATTAEGVLRHLAEFQRIADASDGTRAAGTPGHERSARYAGELLDAAGYDVDYQRLPFRYVETLTERLTRLDAPADDPEDPEDPEAPEDPEDPEDPGDIPVDAMTYTPNTPVGGLEAALAAVPDTGCAAADYASGDHAGRIALVARGDCTFAEKQALAAEAGALAVLVHNNVPGPLAGTLSDPDNAVIPTGGITQADGEALAAELAAGEEVTVRIELEQLSEERTTVNVIAETPGGDPSRVVMAGAHLDSVIDGPGINDNASGAAGILNAALLFAALAPADHPHTVRFALWSAEEFGLLGSEHYVERLTPTERQDIALYLNFDMIGSPNPGFFVYDGEEEAEGGAADQAAPPGSAAISRDLADFLRSRGVAPGTTEFNGRSDYAPFLDAGIPVGGTFSGAEDVKTETEVGLWGGTADAPYDECYHQSCDDLTNVGAAVLETHAQAIAHAVGAYAWHAPE